MVSRTHHNDPRDRFINSTIGPAQFTELAGALSERVQASGADLATLRAALGDAVLYHEMLKRYWAGVEAVMKKAGRPLRDRLAEAGRIVLGMTDRPARGRLQTLGAEYDALVNPAGMSEEHPAHSLYWWRTCGMIHKASLREPKRRKAHRESPDPGGFLPEPCDPAALLTFPLTPNEATAAMTLVHGCPSVEACLQLLKRAKRRGFLKAKLPPTWEHIPSRWRRNR